ncbi:RNA methyltransferase [Flavobacterium sp. JP2137]|uniref:RNA methyltransferase n=1 Tax=Flavobacterium sp. JP2137 TaxID=3414510 RepID=UPI003D2FE660
MRKLANSELNRIDTDAFKEATKSPLILVLDDIRSLHNIGSVFRTSDAFLIEKIYLCGITATPPNKEIHKTALGATETVEWEYVADVVEVLKRLSAEGVSLQAVEQVVGSVMLNDFEVLPQQRYALVFGNEVKGVSQQAIDCCDGVIEIPQLGTKHSLNISVSAGMVVWDLFQKINAKRVSAE